MTPESTPPKGWVIAPVSDVVEILDSRRIPVNATEREQRRGPYPYYGANGQVGTIDDYLFDGDYVLVAEDGGYFDEPTKGVAYRATGKFWVNNHAHVVSPLGCMSAQFLVYALNTIDWIQYVSGTTRLKLTQGSFLKVLLSVPPLNEQRRIVTKIEALKARSQGVKEALEAIPSLLDQFRQSVLAAAFRGDLTTDWREKNPDAEPASVLLERIRAERRRQWKQTEGDINDLPDLPKSWIWSSLEQCFDLERGRFSVRPRNDPNYYNGSYPFVQIGDLPREGGIVEKYSQTLNEKGLNVSKMFPKGSVLIAIVGATIGNTGVLGFDSCCPDSLVAIRSSDSELSQYVEYYMRSRKLAIRRASYASGGQPNINLQTLNPYLFPLPPYDELREINKRVESLNRFSNLIGRQTIEASTQAEYLGQSILAKAFRGELVPQDPNDEPASALLERVQAERAKREAEAKVANKKSTSKTSGQSGRKAKQQDLESIQLGLPGLE